MPTSVQFNLVDRSNERTAVRIPILPMAAGSIAVIEAFETGAKALLADLSLLSVTGSSVNEVTKNAFTLPVDDNAVRELAVRFVMSDANLNQASFSIGGPDLAKFPFTVGEGGDVWTWGTEEVDGDLEDFVSQVLTVARHPISGLAMTMQRLELVGRSN